MMQTRNFTTIAVAAAALIGAPAFAAELPQIKVSAKNAVPQCATPGRLAVFLKARNPALDPRFEHIAVDYMRHGETLGLRWDYAFFQMIVETGGLTYRNGSKMGSVKPDQNNFAGLGATGKGEPGESFSDVSTGVLAHLQHVQMYAGERIDNAVAERTRKVQEWGVLTSWQKGFNRPISFADLGAKWAPGSRAYTDSIESVGDKFYNEFCTQADPRPELIAAARVPAIGAPARTAEVKQERVSGADVARKAIAEQRAENGANRSGLGAGGMAKGLPGGDVKILNAPQPEAIERAPEPPRSEPPKAETPKAEPGKPATKSAAAPVAPVARAPERPALQPTAAAPAAAAGALAKPLAIAQPLTTASGQKCRVWTASYGGQKAVIVQALTDNMINFTVLDVNDGQEAREADAFISAYAKGGSVAGEFATQNAALEKAFELCPEG